MAITAFVNEDDEVGFTEIFWELFFFYTNLHMYQFTRHIIKHVNSSSKYTAILNRYH